MDDQKQNDPVVNVDGTPMVGDSGIDINGNIYGVSDSSNDICTIDDSFSSCDSFSDSTLDSSFDTSFDSSFGDDF